MHSGHLFPMIKCHHRIRYDRSDDTGSEKFLQHRTDDLTAGYPVKEHRKENAPNTAPVRASGGIPINSIRITPIIVAQSREYHGPISTEQTILIRCAVGHIPSIRRIGGITTPIATIIASITIRNVFSLCFSIFVFLSYIRENFTFCLWALKSAVSLFFRSKFPYFLSLRNTDSHRFFLHAGSQGAPPQIHLHFL